MNLYFRYGSDAESLGEIIEYNKVDETLYQFILRPVEDKRIYEILVGAGYAREIDEKPLCCGFGMNRPRKTKLQIGHEKIIYGVITSSISLKELSAGLSQMNLEVTVNIQRRS